MTDISDAELYRVKRETRAGVVWSQQQQAFLDWCDTGTGSCVLVAVAGAGKTTVLIEGGQRIRGGVAYMAYNRDIVDETKAKLQKLDIDWKKMQANTAHGFGMGAYRKARPNVKVSEYKVADILDAMMNDFHPLKVYQPGMVQLISLTKQRVLGVLAPLESFDEWAETADRFDIFDDEDGPVPLNEIVQVCIVALKTSISQLDLVDFDDMIYMPLVHKVRFWQHDNVMVDECFLGDTPVLIGKDGSWMTIKEMVETGYVGPIVSWDKKRGVVVKRVTGHKRILRNKKMKRIRFVQRDDRLGGMTRIVRYGRPILVCTEDHRIKTNRGWTAAKDLKPGQIVYVETAQEKVRDYMTHHKIGEAGKRKLASLQSKVRRGFAKSRAGGNSKAFNKIKGGNGHVSPIEILFAEKMGNIGVDVTQNVPIQTKMKKNSGYPSCYKADFILDGTMTIVEIDGRSHKNKKRKKIDDKRDEFLATLGYTTVRILNSQVVKMTPDQLNEMIQPGCLVEAEVIDVVDYETKEQFVYDLEVDGTNCYFAHGLLVHNCQDTNPARRALVRAMLRKGGRVIAVGDPHQAIYGFTGADADAMDLIAMDFNCVKMGLTISYRCPKAVVKFANQWVSHIEAALTAPEGEVSRVSMEEFFKRNDLTVGSVVLSRTTKPLVSLAFNLIRRRIPCLVKGRDIGKALQKLMTRWKVTTLDALESKLDGYLAKETTKLLAKRQEAKLANVEDSVETIRIIIDQCRMEGKRTIDDAVAYVDQLFGDKIEGMMTLSTIHRMKGKEAPVVFWLDRVNTCPSKWARQDWAQEQEKNLCYVAATRSQDKLIELDAPIKNKAT